MAQPPNLAVPQNEPSDSASARRPKGLSNPSKITMDQRVLSELGDYLLAHSDEIIRQWVLRAIEHNVGMISSKNLAHNELLDHLPRLFQELAGLLKSPQSNQNRLGMCLAARVHGKCRWRQGCRLDDVISEASIIRRILFDNWVDAFAQQVPQFQGETRRAAEKLIHQAVDDVITDSAAQFVEEQEKTIYRLNSELADALFEVRCGRVLTGFITRPLGQRFEGTGGSK